MNITDIDPASSALLTDLYQLTMLQAYFDRGMHDIAVFEFFARKLPRNRNFLVAAGLEQAIDYLEGLRFTEAELDWVARHGAFKPDFVDYLAGLKFSGDVHAMPEGTVFFPDEPILRVVAPLPEAQLAESRLINLLNFQSMIASKAVRCVLAAPGKLLVDFGMRRAHGAEAGLLAARASYIAGFDGTATVLAGARFDIPLFGTMAHSFIQAHDDEAQAFEHFARSLPQNVVLLIDTYDTEAAAEKVAVLARRLLHEGIVVHGVRIDSGDLGEHARKVRKILDDNDLRKVTIFASSSVDERKIQALLQDACPLDGFGVGTHMDTSSDAPYLDCAYKLQEYAGRARRKRSEGKATWPGRKQVYRQLDAQGRMRGDILTLEQDVQEGVPLLGPVMRGGRRVGTAPSLASVRARLRQEMGQLGDALRSLDQAPAYPVTVSPALRGLAEEVDQKMA
ncbi:MAG: nicotinate phosphoribosyltransferase [Nevskia sp.]|nr:nicotinate phosphoribosyltransferase [Nevskia sp.]